MKANLKRCPTCGQALRSTLVREVLGSITKKGTEVHDIKKSVASFGVTDKEIYNALSYLTRHRRIKHIGYGRYALPAPPQEGA